jgi:hypothetical protein
MHCEFLGYCSGVADDPGLLVYDTAPLGDQIPTFRLNIVVSSSRVDTFTFSRFMQFCGVAFSPLWITACLLNVQYETKHKASPNLKSF